MAVIGWLLIGVAFLALVMAVNGSWVLAWHKLQGQEPKASA